MAKASLIISLASETTCHIDCVRACVRTCVITAKSLTLSRRLLPGMPTRFSDSKRNKNNKTKRDPFTILERKKAGVLVAHN